jgi:hypothetical protein
MLVAYPRRLQQGHGILTLKENAQKKVEPSLRLSPLHLELNCTEPSLSVSIPLLKV